jgi:hypothetical protein
VGRPDGRRVSHWLERPDYANRAVAYDAIRGLLSLLNDPSTRFLTLNQADALLRGCNTPASDFRSYERPFRHHI